jgi:hypothetical protein
MRTCPRCGAAFEPGQEYCLACGDRLPVAGLAGSTVRGGAWQRRSALALLVAIAGAAVAIAASDPDPDRTAISTATGDFATVPTTSTLPSPSDEPRGNAADWPAGEDGWTIVLASVPQTKGRPQALARARQARRTGLAQVGVLDSSLYASLHPGYWVVFSGVYASEAEATSALEPAREIARTATVRRVVR